MEHSASPRLAANAASAASVALSSAASEEPGPLANTGLPGPERTKADGEGLNQQGGRQRAAGTSQRGAWAGHGRLDVRRQSPEMGLRCRV
jgi:hypothetical protein